jgi:competence ComEA-like helix-hairpin-helix protein
MSSILLRSFFVACGCAFLIAVGARPAIPVVVAQGVLPEGTGRDVTLRICGKCHGAETVASVRHTPDGWREVIARMVAAGAQGSEQELGTVAQYLSTHFAAEVQKPLDLNTAPAIELESVAGLLRKEAAALITHREKNGPCKKLEDLKNVPGLDYKKIEARKTRLACL